MNKSEKQQREHRAFTMLELIITIVVIAILASLAMPRMKRDIRQEAADNIISALRFTQHMALMDNVTDNISRGVGYRKKWQRKFWRFGKEGCSDGGIFYYVASDRDRGGNIDVNDGEAAIDPSNKKVMMGQNGKPCAYDLSEQVFGNGIAEASPHIFLTKNYGIKENDAKMFRQCQGTSKSIGFDYLGRPHRGFEHSTKPDYSSLMESDCNLTFEFEDGSKDLIITIEKETGHIYKAKN